MHQVARGGPKTEETGEANMATTRTTARAAKVRQTTREARAKAVRARPTGLGPRSEGERAVKDAGPQNPSPRTPQLICPASVVIGRLHHGAGMTKTVLHRLTAS